ncbi:MAG: hypothetical protein ACRD20_20475 [Terriglobales bacterium]
MPHAIDDERMSGKHVMRDGQNLPPLLKLDPAKPPVKFIPHAEYPLVVYRHPNEPFFMVEHRNTKHELVEEELQPTEHEAKAVNSAEELDAALSDGWVREPYIPEAPPNPRAALYDAAKKRASRKSA